MDLGLIIGLAVLFFLLGMVVTYMFLSDQRKSQVGKEETKNEISSTHDSGIDEMEVIVRILRDRKTGNLIVETNQERPEIISGLKSESAGQVSDRQTGAMMDETIIQTQSAAPVQDTTPRKPTAGSPTNTDVAINLKNSLANLWKRQSPSNPESANQSMVLQIDQVLQEMLDESLVRRGLRLVQLPDQSMGIILDSSTFDSIDTVPDEEIQRLIRSAVAEWTKRQKTVSK